MATAYSELFARLGKIFNIAKVVRNNELDLGNQYADVVSKFTADTYATGTIAVSSGVVTLSGGTFPDWAVRGIFVHSDNFYSIKSRDTDTQITLDPSPTLGVLTGVSGGTSYSLLGQSDLHLIGELTRKYDSAINSTGTLFPVLQKAANDILIEMVDDDLIRTNGGGLEEKTVRGALRELIRQMVAGSADVDDSTITIASVTAGGSNKGNGTLVLSSLASQIFAPNNVHSPTIPTELVRSTCMVDSYDKRIAVGAEKFRIQGQRRERRNSKDWPKGSGLDYHFTAANPNYENGSIPGANVLRNGNFESFTSNAPDFWTIAVGSAGSTVDDTTTAYTGSTALEIDADGSAAVKLTQSLGTLGATNGTIKADTPYTLSFAVRTNGASLTAGVLRVYVTDGSAVLNNGDADRKMQIEIQYNEVGALTATYQLKTRACMTPKAISKGAFFVVETSTAFNSGVELYIDNVMLAEMHRPVAGGLACQMIPGSTAFATEDVFTTQVTNNREGEFQTEFDRFFDMEAKGFALPADASPSLSDGLIG